MISKTAYKAHDMNEQNTSVFLAIVEMEYASVRKTLATRPLHKPRSSGTDSLFKRAIEYGGTSECATKVRRQLDNFRADSHNDGAEAPWHENAKGTIAGMKRRREREIHVIEIRTWIEWETIKSSLVRGNRTGLVEALQLPLHGHILGQQRNLPSLN
jgi:hypothetical protein